MTRIDYLSHFKTNDEAIANEIKVQSMDRELLPSCVLTILDAATRVPDEYWDFLISQIGSQ